MLTHQDAQSAEDTKKQNFSQAKDFKIEDIPINTMAKDLQEIERPTAKIPVQPSPMRITPIQNLTDKQKSSPFLNSAPKLESTPKPTPPPIEKNPLISKDAPSATKGTTFIIIGVILLIAISGIGIYYYPTIRQSVAPTNTTPAPESTVEIATTEQETGASESTPEPSAPVAPIFSTENPNRLQIDLATADAKSIKETLNKNAADIKDSGLTAPVEFIVTDLQNNPISFANFAAMSGIKLPKNVLALLENDFSIYIYNNNSIISIGLIIGSSQKIALQNALLKTEATIGNDLEPLILHSNYKLITTPFGKNTYKDYAIRYQNIISPQELSIDYAVDAKHLLIGTTKATIEVLIDKLISAPTATTANTAVPTATEQPAQDQPVDNLLNQQ